MERSHTPIQSSRHQIGKVSEPYEEKLHDATAFLLLDKDRLLLKYHNTQLVLLPPDQGLLNEKAALRLPSISNQLPKPACVFFYVLPG